MSRPHAERGSQARLARSPRCTAACTRHHGVYTPAPSPVGAGRAETETAGSIFCSGTEQCVSGIYLRCSDAPSLLQLHASPAQTRLCRLLPVKVSLLLQAHLAATGYQQQPAQDKNQGKGLETRWPLAIQERDAAKAELEGVREYMDLSASLETKSAQLAERMHRELVRIKAVCKQKDEEMAAQAQSYDSEISQLAKRLKAKSNEIDVLQEQLTDVTIQAAEDVLFAAQRNDMEVVEKLGEKNSFTYAYKDMMGNLQAARTKFDEARQAYTRHLAQAVEEQETWEATRAKLTSALAAKDTLLESVLEADAAHREELHDKTDLLDSALVAEKTLSGMLSEKQNLLKSALEAEATQREQLAEKTALLDRALGAEKTLSVKMSQMSAELRTRDTHLSNLQGELEETKKRWAASEAAMARATDVHDLTLETDQALERKNSEIRELTEELAKTSSMLELSSLEVDSLKSELQKVQPSTYEKELEAGKRSRGLVPPDGEASEVAVQQERNFELYRQQERLFELESLVQDFRHQLTAREAILESKDAELENASKVQSELEQQLEAKVKSVVEQQRVAFAATREHETTTAAYQDLREVHHVTAAQLRQKNEMLEASEKRLAEQSASEAGQRVELVGKMNLMRIYQTALEDDLNMKTCALKTLEAELQEANTAMNELPQMKSLLAIKERGLEEALSINASAMQGLEAERDKASHAESALVQKNKELEAVQAQLAKLTVLNTAQLEQLERTHMELQAKMVAKEAEMQAVKADFDQEFMQFQEALASKDQEKDIALTTQGREFEKAFTSVRVKLKEDKKQALREKDQELAAEKEAAESSRVANLALQRELTSISDELERHEKIVEAQQEKINSLQDERKGLIEKCEGNAKMLKTLPEEKAGLQADNKAKQGKIEELEGEIHEWKAAVSEMRRLALSSEEVLETLQKELDATKKQNGKMEKELEGCLEANKCAVDELMACMAKKDEHLKEAVADGKALEAAVREEMKGVLAKRDEEVEAAMAAWDKERQKAEGALRDVLLQEQAAALRKKDEERLAAEQALQKTLEKALEEALSVKDGERQAGEQDLRKEHAHAVAVLQDKWERQKGEMDKNLADSAAEWETQRAEMDQKLADSAAELASSKGELSRLAHLRNALQLKYAGLVEQLSGVNEEQEARKRLELEKEHLVTEVERLKADYGKLEEQLQESRDKASCFKRDLAAAKSKIEQLAKQSKQGEDAVEELRSAVAVLQLEVDDKNRECLGFQELLEASSSKVTKMESKMQAVVERAKQAEALAAERVAARRSSPNRSSPSATRARPPADSAAAANNAAVEGEVGAEEEVEQDEEEVEQDEDAEGVEDVELLRQELFRTRDKYGEANALLDSSTELMHDMQARLTQLNGQLAGSKVRIHVHCVAR